MSTEEPNQYTALDATKRQIRVLTVRSCKYKGVLVCNLAAISLDEDVEYTALSYVWGEEQAIYPIAVNERLFRIRRTVYDYLLLAADDPPNAPGIFIDAICINQDDIAERNNQVALMGNLYERAANVVVWFGIARSWVPQLTDSFPAIKEPSVLQSCLLSEDACRIPAIGSTQIRDKLRMMLTHHEYWSRVWTTQEYLLPPYLTLRVGCLTLSEIAFHTLVLQSQCEPAIASWTVSFTTVLFDYLDEMRKRFAHCVSIIKERDTWATYSAPCHSMSLQRAMRCFSQQKCSVLRDEIFGFLGLCDSILTPDYHSPLLETYAQVLVEGLVDIQTSPTTRNPSADIVAFCVALSSSLSLPFDHTTTGLILVLAMQRIGVPLSEIALMFGFTQQSRHPQLMLRFKQYPPDVGKYLRIVETKQLLRRVRRAWAENAKLSAPDGVPKTVAAWKDDIIQAFQQHLDVPWRQCRKMKDMRVEEYLQSLGATVDLAESVMVEIEAAITDGDSPAGVDAYHRVLKEQVARLEESVRMAIDIMLPIREGSHPASTIAQDRIIEEQSKRIGESLKIVRAAIAMATSGARSTLAFTATVPIS